jgi:hypothetical protein
MEYQELAFLRPWKRQGQMFVRDKGCEPSSGDLLRPSRRGQWLRSNAPSSPSGSPWFFLLWETPIAGTAVLGPTTDIPKQFRSEPDELGIRLGFFQILENASDWGVNISPGGSMLGFCGLKMATWEF